MRARAPFSLTLLTGDTAWAHAADAAGVDRIGVDIERLGKVARQGSDPDVRISDHTLEDLARVAHALTRASAFVRLDPPHDGTEQQIEAALAAGAGSLMLPFFERVDDARAFLEQLDGRAAGLLLVETAEALDGVETLAGLPGLDELIVGLNDLSRSLGYAHPMAIVGDAVLERVARAAHAHDVPFGFGGIALPRPERALPVDPDLVLARNAALGTRAAWIARSGLAGVTPADLAGVVADLRARLAWWQGRDPQALEAAQGALWAQARALGVDTAHA